MGFSRVEVNKTRCLAARFGVRDLGMAFQYIRPSVSRAIKREEKFVKEGVDQGNRPYRVEDWSGVPVGTKKLYCDAREKKGNSPIKEYSAAVSL